MTTSRSGRPKWAQALWPGWEDAEEMEKAEKEGQMIAYLEQEKFERRRLEAGREEFERIRWEAERVDFERRRLEVEREEFERRRLEVEREKFERRRLEVERADFERRRLEVEREEFERRRLEVEARMWYEDVALRRQELEVRKLRLQDEANGRWLEPDMVQHRNEGFVQSLWSGSKREPGMVQHRNEGFVQSLGSGGKRGAASQGQVRQQGVDKKQRRDGHGPQHGGHRASKGARHVPASQPTSGIGQGLEAKSSGKTTAPPQGASPPEKKEKWRRATKPETERLKKAFGEELLALVGETQETDLSFQRVWRRMCIRLSKERGVLKRRCFTATHYDIGQRTFFGDQTEFLADVARSGWIELYESASKTLKGVCIVKIQADLNAFTNGQAELVCFEKLPVYLEFQSAYRSSSQAGND